MALDILLDLATRTGDFDAEELIAANEAGASLPTPGELHLAGQLQSRIQAELDGDERRMLEMLLEGYTVGEICRRIGIGYPSAGVRIHRLRQKLRKQPKKQIDSSAAFRLDIQSSPLPEAMRFL